MYSACADRLPPTPLRALCARLLALALCGCSDHAQPAAPLAPAPGEKPASAVRPEPRRSDPACIGPLDAPALKLRAATGELKLGVLAGLKDSQDDNVASLRALALELQRRGAELLVASGDLGDTSDAQETLLGTLVATGLPVVVAPGNRELRAELDAAEADLRRRGARLIDLSHTRTVDLGDALLVGLPGAFERKQLRAEGACLYVQQDVDALATFLDKQVPGAPPAILVAAVPPHGEGAAALDASDGQNLGDPHLNPLLSPQRAAFGIFGQVWEAGGRAVDGAGKPLAAGAFAAQLYLNPGAAERTLWPMADGSSAHGLAALVTLRRRQAAYEVVRAPLPLLPRPQ